MNKKEDQLYKKIVCTECNGTGEVGRGWDGCYKCQGKGYQFVKINKKI